MPNPWRSNAIFCQMENTGPVKGQGKPNIARKAILPELGQTFPNILLLFLRRLTMLSAQASVKL